MAAARKQVHRSTREAPGLTGDFADLMNALKTLVDPYRPEQHYMRGPGPKWRAKHDRTASPETSAMPELVRVKG